MAFKISFNISHSASRRDCLVHAAAVNVISSAFRNGNMSGHASGIADNRKSVEITETVPAVAYANF
jgi:hypothetical protein